jgi:neutral ceramidase
MVILLGAGLLSARDFRAGSARIDITPDQSIWMSGYAARTKPSEGVGQKLWAKALAMEDSGRGKVVIVTTDLIGLPASVSDVVAARVAKQHNLDRSRLMLNSSHTHSGPVVRPNLMTMYFLDEPQKKAVADYTLRLTDQLVSVIGAAIGDLAPASISIAHGTAGFAINRRQRAVQPVDHDVPVIAIHRADGKLHTVLFAYACHNTTMGGDYYQINGDYAGFAQSELESMQPGVTAMFMLLCGGDQNPSPRGQLTNAQQHGKTLATEVNRTLGASLKKLAPDFKTSFQVTELAFAPHSREQFEEESRNTNKFRAQRAKEMLQAYDQRRPIRTVKYPVQAIRLAKDVVILALGGEVVVDYAIRTKKQFAGTDVIVAGYSNEVMCYIPSKRVLGEGGYEAADSMIYYGQPGPFTDEVEETVFRSIYHVMRNVGFKEKK